MATAIALKRAAATPLLSKLTNPVRCVSAFRSFNSDTGVFNSDPQVTPTHPVTPTGGDSPGSRIVEVDRPRSSQRGLGRRSDTAPSFFSDTLDPFFPTRSLSQVLNLMDQFLENPFLTSPRGVGAGSSRRGFDVKEDENAVYICMDMPGLSKEDVRVAVEQYTLVIKGEEPGEESKEWDDSGRRRYSSRLELPSNLYKLDQIKGEMKNGVLKLVVPKAKEEERKDVYEVKVE